MDQVTLVKNQYRLEQWTKLIQECRSSGMKVDDWCEANGVTHHAYYYWLRKIRQAACLYIPTVNAAQNPSSFKRLEVQTPAARTQSRCDYPSSCRYIGSTQWCLSADR